MAAPHVAGIAALVISMGVTEPAAVENILRRTAVVPEHGGRDKELYGSGIVSASNAVEFVHTRNALARGIALLALLAMVIVRIRTRKGQLASVASWLPLAVLSSVGLFFLPWLVPHVVPGVDIAMRPIGEWSMLLGVGIHRWLPLANVLLVLGLVAIGFGRKNWRAPIGGFALGTCAFLLAGLFTGFQAAPLGSILRLGWYIANAIGCFWIARIALDKKTAEN
jgi:serine protease